MTRIAGLDDLRAHVGRTLGPTAWRTVDQDTIDTFAAISGDRQWIHTDTERARRESPFGTTIAHGTLTLAMIDGFRDELVALEGFDLGVNVGYDRVRFPAPVRAGARLRAKMTLAALTERDGGWWELLQRFEVEVEPGDPGRPACMAESIIRVRPPG